MYLDEPVSALDVTVQDQLLDSLIEIQQRLQITYVFVSHDFTVIARIAHRIAAMQDGKLVEEGPTPQILGSPRTVYTKPGLNAVPRGLHAHSSSYETCSSTLIITTRSASSMKPPI